MHNLQEEEGSVKGDSTTKMIRKDTPVRVHDPDGCPSVDCPCYRRGREEALEPGR